MDELNQNLNASVPPTVSPSNPSAVPEAPLKSKFWKFAVWFVAIVVVAGIVLWVVDYFSPEARSARETQRNYELYQQSISEMEAALRADTYGGATPQETLDLFVTALRAGDVELASKYFALDTNTQSEEYLTRRKWEIGLQKAKTEAKLEEIADNVSSAKPGETSSELNTAWFDVFESSGLVTHEILLKLNEYSNVWKIQSL